MTRPAVYRAPMRARTLDLPAGSGAEPAVERGLVGIGEPLPAAPRALDEAVAALGDRFGQKAARLLEAFAGVPDGAFVWTRTGDGRFRLGRLDGPWRYDSSADARRTGIAHVRPADWLERPFGPDEVPGAVAATFARGGRNFQRTHGEEAERGTLELWRLHRGGPG